MAEWGEEKWRQAKLVHEFHLASHFDEGAVVIYYGVLCEPPFREVGRVKDLFRFLALCA